MEQKQKNDIKLPEKPRIIYTPEAWSKQCLLIMTQSGEVGWHGLVETDPGQENVFRITDILTYPQTVDKTTVKTDEIEYGNWLDGLSDEQFSKVRFHGHSHVEMGVTPSPTDEHDKDTIVQQLKEGSYYIFMIWNKKLNFSADIYDLKNMIRWNASEISVEIEGMGAISDWLDKQSEQIREKKEVKQWILQRVMSSFAPIKSTVGYTSSAVVQSAAPSSKYYPDWD